MTRTINDPPQAPLRSPDVVMRLDRIGAFHPTRLSFMRSLLRLLAQEGAQVTRPVWDMDEQGFGRAVYSVALGGYTYSLVAFSHDLPADQRSDRVIAQAWDATFALFDGHPDINDLDRLAMEVPRQEAGRCSERELVLSRANKSVRLFSHVAQRLAQGAQPDAGMLDAVGYLMRTTAVYGNGKFGIADRDHFASRPAMAAPFRAEMLSVWLIRAFSIDLVEHVAKCRGGKHAARLSPALKQHLGIGNATGLGMAPFLVNHPTLLHQWMAARETALARVLALGACDAATQRLFQGLFAQARAHAGGWRVESPTQRARIDLLCSELTVLGAELPALLQRLDPWQAIWDRCDGLSLETQELVLSLLLEPHGALIDDLTETMSAPPMAPVDPTMPVGALLNLFQHHAAWSQTYDFGSRRDTERFWYVSEEKLEPRIGARYDEPGAELESPLDIARQLQALGRALRSFDPDQPCAAFLAEHPELRHAVRRLQAADAHPYMEIRDNLIGADCLPIDMLRCKLSFFGASRFDPRSDLWTRITMYQGAPGPDELSPENADNWAFAALDTAQGAIG